MAWPTPDLEDVILSYDTGGKRWLHALCLALNERQASMGVALTEFIKGDGSEDSMLDITDFTGLWIGGPDDGAVTNLNRVMGGLKTMLAAQSASGSFGIGSTYQQFTTTSGSSGSGYTLSSLQTAIGLGSFPDECESWADLNFWKQLKESFDLLIYARRYISASRGSVSERQSPSFDIDPEVAWDSCYADSPSTVSGTSTYGWLAFGYQTSFGAYRFVVREGPSEATINTTSLSGTLTEAYLSLAAYVGADGNPAQFPSGWTCEGLTFYVDTVGLVATGDIAIGANNVLTVDCLENMPATYEPAVVVDPIYPNISVQGALIYFDIAAELTDQA